LVENLLTKARSGITIRKMSKSSTIELEQMAEMFKALSNPHRLQIFVRLASCQVEPDGDGCEGQVCACVGSLGRDLDIAPSTVSHHIKELAQAGLIKMNRKGQTVECHVDPAVVQLMASYFQSLAQPVSCAV
jgi:ArsR family transcriptional regulator